MSVGLQKAVGFLKSKLPYSYEVTNQVLSWSRVFLWRYVDLRHIQVILQCAL